MTLNYPKDKFYKNQPLTFRNASGNGDKFQILKSKIYRVLKATTDEEDIKKLQESLSELDILEEDEIKAKKANETELEENRENEIKEDGKPDKDKEILKHRRIDDPEDPKMQNERDQMNSRYSVLEYKTASVEDSSDDNFMEQIVKGKKGEHGDSFMKKLGLREN